MLALACSVLTIPSNPHGNWSLLMKHADILKAWKVKTVAFCLFPLWAWLSLRNRFSRWIAGHRASPCGVRDAKLGFYLPLGANNHSGFPLLRFGVGVGSDRPQGLWLGLSIRAFLWPHVEPGSSHSTVPHDGGHFLKKKISWINLLVPMSFQTWFWTFINFYFKHNSQRLWKPTERLEWRPSLSLRGYNLCPVRTDSLEVCIHFYSCLGFGADLILYHHLAYETPIGAACTDLRHSCWQLRDR